MPIHSAHPADACLRLKMIGKAYASLQIGLDKGELNVVPRTIRVING